MAVGVIGRRYGTHRRCEESPSEPDPQPTPGEDSCKSSPPTPARPGPEPGIRGKEVLGAATSTPDNSETPTAHLEYQYAPVRRQILRPPAQPRHADLQRANRHIGQRSAWRHVSPNVAIFRVDQGDATVTADQIAAQRRPHETIGHDTKLRRFVMETHPDRSIAPLNGARRPILKQGF